MGVFELLSWLLVLSFRCVLYLERDVRTHKKRFLTVRRLPGSPASAEPALTAEQKKTRALRSRLSGTVTQGI